jgi:hypothetical protein
MSSAAWNYIDNTTSLECQFLLNASYFQSNRASATSTLLNWMYTNLDENNHKGVPHVDVYLDEVLPYSRNTTRFSLSPNGSAIIRHRLGISGNRTRNEVIWKVANYNGSFPPDYMKPAPQWDYSYKIEFDLTCMGNKTAISSYARMNMSQPVVIRTAGDVNTYFPNFTSFYNLDPSYIFNTTEYTQYVKDCNIKIAGDKAQFTTELNYDHYLDYLNDYLSPTNSRPSEFSIKVDKEDAKDWATAMSNARAVFDYLLFYSPYMLTEGCTEINTLPDQTSDGHHSNKGLFGLGSVVGIVILVVASAICVITLLSIGSYLSRDARKYGNYQNERLIERDSGIQPIRVRSEMSSLRSSRVSNQIGEGGEAWAANLISSGASQRPYI